MITCIAVQMIAYIAVVSDLAAPQAQWMQLKPPSGWVAETSAGSISLRQRNDWVRVTCGPRDPDRHVAPMAGWSERRRFHSPVLTTTDEWSDWAGPSKRRRRVFRAEVGLRQVDACLEADAGDFEARCTAFTAIIRSISFEKPHTQASAVLTLEHGLDLDMPLPKGAVTQYFLALGRHHIRLASQALEAVLPVAVKVQREREKKDGSTPGNDPQAPQVSLPDQGVRTELQKKAAADPFRLKAMSEVLPSDYAALVRACRKFAATLDHLRRVVLSSGTVTDEQEAVEEEAETEAEGAGPSQVIPSIPQAMSEYDAWARSLGGVSVYRSRGNERATVLYQFGGESRRALVGVRLATDESSLKYTLVWVDGEVEGLVGDIVDLLRSGAEQEILGPRADPKLSPPAQLKKD